MIDPSDVSSLSVSIDFDDSSFSGASQHDCARLFPILVNPKQVSSDAHELGIGFKANKETYWLQMMRLRKEYKTNRKIARRQANEDFKLRLKMLKDDQDWRELQFLMQGNDSARELRSLLVAKHKLLLQPMRPAKVPRKVQKS